MSRPVRPPTLPRAACADEAALVIVELAELCTLLKPSDAFDTFVDTVSLAFDAASPAFSVVDDAFRY